MSVRRNPTHKPASIVIPCWNALSFTKECLASLLRCTTQPYELIFVDNGSTDGTRAFLKGLAAAKRARVVRNETNLGFGRAINQGMTLAQGDYIVWLNNDAIVTPGWLDRLIACAERHPEAGGVGPLVNADPGRASATPTGRPDQTAAAFALRSPGQDSRVPWLIGFCLLLKRAAVEQVGQIDRRFGAAYLEDYDYCLRLRLAGFELFLAQDAYVHHHWHKSFPNTASAQRAFAANREIFIEKWCRRSLDFLLELPSLQHHDAMWTKASAK